jgi:hypothetical protein
MDISMDMEWNVELERRGPITTAPHTGRTAVITFALKNNIYILQVSPYVYRDKFPSFLRSFLSNPKVRKIGRGIKSDLKHLQNEIEYPVPFSGDVELVNMAHARGLVPNRTSSLAELCARILHLRMDKNPTI